MAVKRELKSKIAKPAVKEVEERSSAPAASDVQPEVVENEKGELIVKQQKKRGCSFCQNKNNPRYWDIASIKRYTNDRGRIYPRSRSGACGKHQRAVGKHIKYARHLGMLPFKMAI